MSNISGYTGPIFAIFSPYESCLCTDDGSVLFFPNLVNFCPVILEFTLLKRAIFSLFFNFFNGRFSSHERAFFVSMIDLKFLFQYLEGRCYGNQMICERQVQHGQKTGVFCQILPDILDLFSQSFHLMKALYVQMMDLYFFFKIWSTSVQ